MHLTLCPHCHGHGERDFYACPHCDGTGRICRTEGDHQPAPRPLSLTFSDTRTAALDEAVDQGDAAKVFVLAHLEDGGRAA